jgi:hypothetical protein
MLSRKSDTFYQPRKACNEFERSGASRCAQSVARGVRREGRCGARCDIALRSPADYPGRCDKRAGVARAVERLHSLADPSKRLAKAFQSAPTRALQSFLNSAPNPETRHVKLRVAGYQYAMFETREDLCCSSTSWCGSA